MEYICRIYKNGENPIVGIELPLFNTKPELTFGSGIGYTLCFIKDDRYSPYIIYVHPPKELTEEQYKVINEKGNYCIENDLDKYDFEL